MSEAQATQAQAAPAQATQAQAADAATPVQSDAPPPVVVMQGRGGAMQGHGAVGTAVASARALAAVPSNASVTELEALTKHEIIESHARLVGLRALIEADYDGRQGRYNKVDTARVKFLNAVAFPSIRHEHVSVQEGHVDGFRAVSNCANVVAVGGLVPDVLAQHQRVFEGIRATRVDDSNLSLRFGMDHQCRGRGAPHGR
jgi:hypothetical protein